MTFTCRLCGAYDDEQSNFVDLFGDSKVATDNLEFIKSQLHIWIDSEDLLTHHVCLNCSMVNDHFSRYSKKCQATQSVLQRRTLKRNLRARVSALIPENAPATPDTMSLVKVKEEPHSHVEVITEHHRDDDIDIIDVDDDVNMDSDQLVDDETSPTQPPIVTDEEPKIHTNVLKKMELKLFTFVESEDNEEDRNEPEYALLQHKRCFRCEICKENAIDRKALSNHFRQIHADESLFCYQCEYVTLIKDRLKQHIKECHDKNFKCDVCPAVFGKRCKLKAHVADFHTEAVKDIECSLCDDTFKLKYEFQKHERTVHLKEGRWVCHLCPTKEMKQFSQRHLLELHVMKEHYANKRVKCPVDGCQFYARHKYYMTQHNREVHEKKFNCPHCGKLESKLSRIKEHVLRKHTPKEQKKCPKCKKVFTSRGWYDRHIKGDLCVVV